jgi:uncharacterized protein with PQ loop repeat
MAPQKSIPLAASILGLIGTVFWCVQILPQIWKSWRRKSTEGLPPTMMLLWSASGMPFGVYAISQNFNIPLQIQPQFFCLFCAVSWGQCMYYGRYVRFSRGAYETGKMSLILGKLDYQTDSLVGAS